MGLAREKTKRKQQKLNHFFYLAQGSRKYQRLNRISPENKLTDVLVIVVVNIHDQMMHLFYFLLVERVLHVLDVHK
jgi:hypothetical protein